MIPELTKIHYIGPTWKERFYFAWKVLRGQVFAVGVVVNLGDLYQKAKEAGDAGD